MAEDERCSSEEEETVGALGDQQGFDEDLKIPDRFAHLPEYRLIQTFARTIHAHVVLGEKKVPTVGFVDCEISSDPSRQTVPCLLQGCPEPHLGQLPDDKYTEELQSNPLKEAKQRRDVIFPPTAEHASWIDLCA